jgi:phage repressor protein C with HTH and peptisase S24 domain
MDISLSAGIGRTVFEFIDTLQKLAFSRAFLRRKQARPEDCVVMDVRGDSMWPTLSDGDHVLINRADTRIIDGRIYALIVGGEAKIKRLRKMYHGGLAVISDNRSYGEEEVPPEGMEHVTIIGRALQRSGEL